MEFCIKRDNFLAYTELFFFPCVGNFLFLVYWNHLGMIRSGSVDNI